jgi:hypothetical protein
MNPTWDNIPEELKWARQWLLAMPNEEGELKVPARIYNGHVKEASNKDPSHWYDFETACELASAYGLGIGYVLTADDAYACIDMDVKNQFNAPNEPNLWTTQAQIDRFWRIACAFDSYTEKSRSMQGLHIWVRGKIGQGCKFDGVEVYSQERFIVCTGAIVLDKPIEYRQDYLESLVAEIRMRQGADKGGQLDLVELEETDTDEEVFNRAMNAGNAEKFNALCACTSDSKPKARDGSYRNMGYESQSDADLALMSIFTFYSKSNEQCRRLFRMTGLGKRDKAQKDDRYLNLTLRLIRSRQAREAAMDEQSKAMAASLVQELQQQAIAANTAPVGDIPQPVATSAAVGPQPPATGIDWPPGLAGAIAWHIYQSAPRPVKEVAIVSALGFLAGVCGKAYQIPGSGLNLYIVLVARSAIGKEAMHSGIGGILAELRESIPPVQRFVDFTDFVSGPALQKACAANLSFVNVSGEFGKKLERLAREDGRDAAMHSLRTVMTNLYQKSGPTSVVAGLGYSDKDKNVASVSGVAYSMIGETTPKTFFNSLTETMMEDGFLSRFTIIEYAGERPDPNPNPITRMDQGLAQALHQLVVQAITILDRTNKSDVQFESQAWQMLDEFNKFCDGNIRAAGDDESQRQMWNRAHLKAMRIAGLLAVADNHLVPVVYPQHVSWAIDLISRDIAMFQRRLDEGDIGTGDAVCETKLMATVKEYLESGVSDSYKIPDALRKAGIIPRKVLQIKLARVTAFSNHRNGATFAMDSALRSLCDSGYLAECDRTKLAGEHNFHGKAYRVMSLPASRGKRNNSP